MNDDKDAFLSDVAPEPRRGGVIRREVLEAQQEAARIVESARGEAEAVLARAREEAAALRAEAEARGHSEGIDRIARIVAGFEAERAAFLAAQEPTILQLALAVARKLLTDAFREDAGAYRGLVEGTIGRFPCGSSTEIHVHPDDVPAAEKAIADLEARGTARTSMSLVADPRIERQGIRLISALGTVDASLSLHLASIAKAWQCPPGEPGEGRP